VFDAGRPKRRDRVREPRLRAHARIGEHRRALDSGGPRSLADLAEHAVAERHSRGVDGEPAVTAGCGELVVPTVHGPQHTPGDRSGQGTPRQVPISSIVYQQVDRRGTPGSPTAGRSTSRRRRVLEAEHSRAPFARRLQHLDSSIVR
jgi:hypothetical protein